MDDAMAQVILSEMNLRGMIQGPSNVGIDAGGTVIDAEVISGTLTPSISTAGPTTLDYTAGGTGTYTQIYNAVPVQQSFVVPENQFTKSISGVQFKSADINLDTNITTFGIYDDNNGVPGLLISDTKTIAAESWPTDGTIYTLGTFTLTKVVNPGSKLWMKVTNPGSNASQGPRIAKTGGYAEGYNFKFIVDKYDNPATAIIKTVESLRLNRIIFAKPALPANTIAKVHICGALVRTGTMASATALDAGASAVDDTYNGKIIVLKTGTGLAQVRKITDYTGSTKVPALDSAWTTTPVAGTTYDIYDLVAEDVPSGFVLDNIDKASYPTINIVLALEKKAGATASPKIGIPVVASIEKDLVSQPPIIASPGINSVYNTICLISGNYHLDAISVSNGTTTVSLRVTVDGALFFSINVPVSSSTAFPTVLLPMNKSAGSTILVEAASVNTSTGSITVNYSK